MKPAKPIGRRKPYTASGVRRRPCARCGRRAHAQWQVCANGNRYLPICPRCDVELNRLVLDWMNLPGRDELLARYESNMPSPGP